MMEYTIKKLSGYQFMKLMGDGKKDQVDIIRDLIIATVEPAMTKAEVETLPLHDFLELSGKVTKELGLEELTQKNFQNLTP